jgi:acyl-CoA thioester hydrolase
MTEFHQQVQLRWSDLDPNFHVRHSVYYDWGALLRMSLLSACGLTPEIFVANHLGPILFREECVFRKEIRFNDQITINGQLLKATADGGRWTLRHELMRNNDTLCAIITVDGAWLDTRTRKLTTLPEQLKPAFAGIPKAADFTTA